MGRTRTIPIVVVFDRVLATDGKAWREVRHTPAPWDTRRYGKPTEANLARFIQELESSTAPDGVNAHLGVMQVSAARIVRQRDGKVLAIWQPRPFGVLGTAPRFNPDEGGSRKDEAFSFLYEFYGSRLTKLPVDQQDALAVDTAGIAHDEHMPMRKAVQTLDSRIANKLEAYAKTLVAGPSRFRRNPKVTVFHANPRQRGGRSILQSSRVYEIAYKHVKDGKAYKHPFKTGVCMELLPDGSIRIYSRTGKRLWKDFR